MPSNNAAEAFGAWREKVRFGKAAMGIQRSTFLIDRSGRIARVWKNVSVDGHDTEVLEALAQLGARPTSAG